MNVHSVSGEEVCEVISLWGNVSSQQPGGLANGSQYPDRLSTPGRAVLIAYSSALFLLGLWVNLIILWSLGRRNGCVGTLNVLLALVCTGNVLSLGVALSRDWLMGVLGGYSVVLYSSTVCIIHWCLTLWSLTTTNWLFLLLSAFRIYTLVSVRSVRVKIWANATLLVTIVVVASVVFYLLIIQKLTHIRPLPDSRHLYTCTVLGDTDMFILHLLMTSVFPGFILLVLHALLIYVTCVRVQLLVDIEKVPDDLITMITPTWMPTVLGFLPGLCELPLGVYYVIAWHTPGLQLAFMSTCGRSLGSWVVEMVFLSQYLFNFMTYLCFGKQLRCQACIRLLFCGHVAHWQDTGQAVQNDILNPLPLAFIKCTAQGRKLTNLAQIYCAAFGEFWSTSSVSPAHCTHTGCFEQDSTEQTASTSSLNSIGVNYIVRRKGSSTCVDALPLSVEGLQSIKEKAVKQSKRKDGQKHSSLKMNENEGPLLEEPNLSRYVVFHTHQSLSLEPLPNNIAWDMESNDSVRLSQLFAALPPRMLLPYNPDSMNPE